MDHVGLDLRGTGGLLPQQILDVKDISDEIEARYLARGIGDHEQGIHGEDRREQCAKVGSRKSRGPWRKRGSFSGRQILFVPSLWMSFHQANSGPAAIRVDEFDASSLQCAADSQIVGDG